MSNYPDSTTEIRWQLWKAKRPTILVSALMPDYTCLAIGSLSNLNAVMFSALKRHKFQLFPDLSEFISLAEKK